MNSGVTKSELLARRFYILEHIESIISTSVYYRNHSANMVEENKKIVGSIDDIHIKAKIL